MPDVKRVLILGSGFSKAVFDCMPTVTDLKPLLRKTKDLSVAPYDGFADNPELLLSYLALSQPWKESASALHDQALFVQVQEALGEYIAASEARAFRKPPPDWAVRLIEHLHDAHTSVLTLNYDTLVERIVYQLKFGKPDGTWPTEYDLYDLPLSSLRLRSAGTFGRPEVTTFRLIKLHGSINWYYSGVEGFAGEQVYFRAVNSESPNRDDWGGKSATDRQIKRLSKDKRRLIIPPVAEKSRFYENRTVRALWVAARDAVLEADEVLFVRYSLPESDLTMKLFLQAFARPRKVTIVDIEAPGTEKGQQLLRRYREVFPNVEIDAQPYMCEGAVEKMVEYMLA